jgi:NitT/TauT family transport system permease protein
MFMAVILITIIGVMLYGMVVGLELLVIVRDARIQ